MPPEVALTESLWPAEVDQPLLHITIGDLLRQLAREVPERIGFVEAPLPPMPTRRWTNAQLLAEAERSARALLRHFRPGEKVAVWSPNCAEWVLLQHGAAMAGLVLVTVNPAYLGEEVHHVLSTSGAVGLFHVREYRGLDVANVVAQLRGRLPALRECFELAQWGDFTAQSQPGIGLPVVSPHDVAQIQFTSGTTGKPKGARLHHLGLVNASRFAAQRATFPDGGVWATAMPLFHVGGSAGSHLGALTSRGTFVLQPQFDAGDMLRIIEREQVNHFHGVPTMVMRMLDHPERPQRDLRSLRTLMSGGSLVPDWLVRRAREELGSRFTITYGQTEANGVICQTSPDDTLERQTTSIGRPARCAELKVADPATGAVRAIGEPGEIWVRGYQVMQGYFSLPAGVADAVTADGWLCTGDVAAMDAAGYLRITGRLKDCIIRGGENIYPMEIEEVLRQHPAVQEVQVVGEADTQWGEVVAAVVQLNPGVARPTALDLYHHCSSRLAAYKLPVRWYCVDSFPTTSSGKIQKYALREQIAQGALKPEPFEKPSRKPVQV
ncbi:class I adenylate-forming enzyme family protein [Hydrogenophaga sp. BPS33]|uniref:class I adenylate-forming enzyme family protein n=1 Tax=Hydrogenophaga sp. BPS33 TaxID=2651974 RepID=UPI001F31ECB0|nr:AMP-binding protein [Hydrogenophaga sp. BPS33]